MQFKKCSVSCGLGLSLIERPRRHKEHTRFVPFSIKIKNFNRELKQRRGRRRRQGELQKSNRFRLAKQQLCTCITLFCTLASRRCTTTTGKCLISRFVEDWNTRQQLSFSFPELWHSPLEFKFKKLQTFDQKVRARANSLFK